MYHEFRRTLKNSLGVIIGWGIGLILYSLLLVLITANIPSFSNKIPTHLLRFFGGSPSVIYDLGVFLDVFFFNPLILPLGILAVDKGAKILVTGKEDHYEITHCHPAARSGLFWARILSFLVTILSILAISWLSWALPSRFIGLDLSFIELARPFLVLFGQLVLFGTLSLFLSLVLYSPSVAGFLAGVLLVGNYLLVGLTHITQKLGPIARFTPLYYFQGGRAISGIDKDWTIILFELIVLFFLLSWWRFLSCEIPAQEEEEKKEDLPWQTARSGLSVPFLRRLRQPIIFIGQRLLFGLLVLSFITYASFLGLDMARGKPFQKAASDSAVKTINYAGDVLQGDLGETSSGSVSLLPKPVTEVVPTVLVRSLGLLGAALIFSTVFGVLLGVLIAGKRSGVTLLALLGSITGVSIPSFFAALLLQLGVIKITQIYGKTILPVGGFGWDIHLLLPMLVLAARPLAQITRVSYVTVEEIIGSDFVRTAFSKGLGSFYVMFAHIIRNAAVPILTTIGLSLRFALSSLPIVEFFFGWQGLGYTLLQSISNRDDHLTIILALCMGLLFILVNLLLDGSYLLIDPRLRELNGSISVSGRKGLVQNLKMAIRNIKDFFNERPWLRLIKQEKGSEISPFKSILESRDEEISYNDPFELGKDRVRVWIKAVFGNPALILGCIIVFSLMGVILFSPQFSPHSPYTTQGLSIVDGEFLVPPFEPDEVYPWGTDPLGRDIMSLIFAGAQQTFTLAFFVVGIRLMIGFLLGAIVGWFSGSWLDRFVLGAAETIAAFPALLLVMVLILGIGIRQGLRPFIIALSFIGWSEIMQYVRSKVIEIKPELFIESAAAVGAGSNRIIQKHIFPNIIPGLISILSLEMGAVLMLLGELGFIGIFIGGGAFAELEIWGPPFHYSDVPEWGALLSNIRIYARSYPWTALYPAGAFFVAIIGFNFLGEGIRRLIDIVGVAATRLIINKYTLALVGVLITLFFWFRGTTGSTAVFQTQAKTFNGQRAYDYLQILTDYRWEGRSLGSEGMDQAAEYIAGQFQALGLQPAGENFTYYQTRPRTYQQLSREPILTFSDDSFQPSYHQDYVEYSGRYRNLGMVEGEVLFLGMGDLMQVGQWWQNYPALDDLDFTGQIVAVLSDQDVSMIQDVPKAGLLVVTEDPNLISQRTTLSSRSPFFNPYGSTETIGQETPVLRISTELANHLLTDSGYRVDTLQIRIDDLKQDEFVIIPTEKKVTMDVYGEIFEDEEARHVIGHLPGVKGDPRAQLDNQLVIVLAQYDSPPIIRTGQVSESANDNASGVAVMLELIRTIQESGYQPNRTFLFIAYAGEGLEGGEWVYPDISKFLQTKYGFSTAFDLEAVIELRGVGAGSGNAVLLSTRGSLRLVELFESSARRLGIPVKRAEDRVDLSVIFEEGDTFSPASEAPFISMYWDEWWTIGGTVDDNIEMIDPEFLQKTGEVLSLGTMVIGHELNY